MKKLKRIPLDQFKFDAEDPARIPEGVRDRSRMMDVELGPMRPWWRRPVPDRGIPVVFAERGTYKPGTPGWIIDSRERTVYIGPDKEMKETLVGEFTVVIPNGSQCTAQVGRDIRMVDVEALKETAKKAAPVEVVQECNASQRASGRRAAA